MRKPKRPKLVNFASFLRLSRQRDTSDAWNLTGYLNKFSAIGPMWNECQVMFTIAVRSVFLKCWRFSSYTLPLGCRDFALQLVHIHAKCKIKAVFRRFRDSYGRIRTFPTSAQCITMKRSRYTRKPSGSTERASLELLKRESGFSSYIFAILYQLVHILIIKNVMVSATSLHNFEIAFSVI